MRLPNFYYFFPTGNYKSIPNFWSRISYDKLEILKKKYYNIYRKIKKENIFLYDKVY